MDAFTNKTSQQPAAGGAAGQKDDYVDKGEFFPPPSGPNDVVFPFLRKEENTQLT